MIDVVNLAPTDLAVSLKFPEALNAEIEEGRHSPVEITNILSLSATSELEQRNSEVGAKCGPRGIETYDFNLETDMVDNYRFADNDFDGYEAPWNNDFSNGSHASANSDYIGSKSEQNENTMSIDKDTGFGLQFKVDGNISLTEIQEAESTDGNLASGQKSFIGNGDNQEKISCAAENQSGNSAAASKVAPIKQSNDTYFKAFLFFSPMYFFCIHCGLLNSTNDGQANIW